MKAKVKKFCVISKKIIDKHFEVFYFILFVIAAAICTVIVKHKCLLLYNWQCALVGLFFQPARSILCRWFVVQSNTFCILIRVQR